MKLWDAASGRLLRSLEGHTSFVRSVAWDAVGARLASAADDYTVKLWDAASGRLLRSLEGHTSSVRSVAWDAAGARLACASSDGAIYVYDLSADEVRLMARLFGVIGDGGVAVTPDSYLSGDPDAIASLSFVDGWATYHPKDIPGRIVPDRVTESLRVQSPPKAPAQPRAKRPPSRKRSR